MKLTYSCNGKTGGRCTDFDGSCAQTDPINAPCDFYCVKDCPNRQASLIVNFEGASGEEIAFRKCVDEDEIKDNFIEPRLMCDAGNGGGPAQFEVQLPKIKRHPY